MADARPCAVRVVAPVVARAVNEVIGVCVFQMGYRGKLRRILTALDEFSGCTMDMGCQVRERRQRLQQLS